MSTHRLRVGVVGVGHLGRHHARILASLPGAELVGVVDAREEQARAIAEPLGVPAFTDHQELLSRVDAVSVAVPTVHHRAVAGSFLERGIPTLVEKPLASSLFEAEELVRLARETGTTLQVGHIERFNPAFVALANSELTPKYIEADRLGLFTFRSTDIGVVHDLMIHDLDLLLSLVPAPVRSVSAVGVSLFGDREDVASARIEFEDGTVAALTASRASFQATRKMRVWSTQGYASLDFATREATFIRPSESFRRGGIDPTGLDLSKPSAVKDHIFGEMLKVETVPPPADSSDQLTAELADFLRVVRRESTPRVPGIDALRAMRVADQVVRALESHQWDGSPEGPVGPRGTITIHEPSSGIPAPKSWTHAPSRQASARQRPLGGDG
jgi:predicted dehydrogenase